DESCPLVDARLPDGSRVNAIIPPLAIQGPVLTIRRFPHDPWTLERLVSLGTVSQEMADYLKQCVRARRSVIISGGTGSGKTSTLNTLGRCIPSGERIVTIEDAAELRLGHPHLISLESRPPNIEGKGEVPIRTLVRNALRMRPDRIIVGEVRGAEAFDMLQAMNTGHRGSLTTLHANSPSDALVRLESMVLMAGFDIPVSAIRRMIVGAISVIVQQDRLPDGRRVVTAITELDRKSRTEPRLMVRFFYDIRKGKHQPMGADKA
ncbi:MAG: ATPase, T2SS/T4P/T4SS family, partial [Anaerolineales bacterium]